MMGDNDENRPLGPKDKVDAYLRLYERQMTHYEKTQDVEWKGSFGVWTLLAAAIYWTSQHSLATKSGPVFWGLIGLALVPFLAHSLWLWKVHRSEEWDKKLWSRYRREARVLLLESPGKVKASLRSDEEEHKLRGIREELVWLGGEVATSAALTAVLVLFLLGAFGHDVNSVRGPTRAVGDSTESRYRGERGAAQPTQDR